MVQAWQQMSVTGEQVAGVNFRRHIVELATGAVGKYNRALVFETLKVVDHFTAEKADSVGK